MTLHAAREIMMTSEIAYVNQGPVPEWVLSVNMKNDASKLPYPEKAATRPDAVMDALRDELSAGLLSQQATLPPKLFYDKLGSTLFTAICELPEYYLTRTEATIFGTHSQEISNHLPEHFRMVDLGAGDCRKAVGLFEKLQPAHYTPVDISGEFLHSVTANLRREFPSLDIAPVVCDFTRDWTLPAAMMEQHLLFFYPGSSIGNFRPPEAAEFLRRLRHMQAQTQQPRADQQRWLLIGVDLVKEIAVLEAAYDDALGVTAAFNRNCLPQVNRLLGADFALADWQHKALFNPVESRIEMHLVAVRNLTVRWQGGERRFAQGQTIHTENSYKYTQDSFDQVLRAAGFTPVDHFQDDDQAFLVVLAK